MSETLPFGKHRGEPLDAVPKNYLRWAVNNCDLSPWLLTAVKAELVRRGERHVPAIEVLAALEDALTERVSDDPVIPHEMAGVVTDHVLEAFAEVCQRYGIVQVTDMVISPEKHRWSSDA